MDKTLNVEISAFRTGQTDTPNSDVHSKTENHERQFEFWAKIDGTDTEYGFNSPEDLARVIVHSPDVMEMLKKKNKRV